MEELKDMDISTVSFILRLNELLKEETYDYSFYDFDRIEMKEKDKMYIKIEQIKKNTNYLRGFCDEINPKLIGFEITNIGNIICGKTYKKSKDNVPLQMQTGYYYSFTVICKKKLI
jgi:hypothetical protein